MCLRPGGVSHSWALEVKWALRRKIWAILMRTKFHSSFLYCPQKRGVNTTVSCLCWGSVISPRVSDPERCVRSERLKLDACAQTHEKVQKRTGHQGAWRGAGVQVRVDPTLCPAHLCCSSPGWSRCAYRRAGSPPPSPPSPAEPSAGAGPESHILRSAGKPGRTAGCSWCPPAWSSWRPASSAHSACGLLPTLSACCWS